MCLIRNQLCLNQSNPYFVISQIRFRAIKFTENLWSQNRNSDITKSIWIYKKNLWYHKIISIFWYHNLFWCFDFSAPQRYHNSILWYKYHKSIQNLWYKKKNDLSISNIRLYDVKNNVVFVTSQNMDFIVKWRPIEKGTKRFNMKIYAVCFRSWISSLYKSFGASNAQIKSRCSHSSITLLFTKCLIWGVSICISDGVTSQSAVPEYSATGIVMLPG